MLATTRPSRSAIAGEPAARRPKPSSTGCGGPASVGPATLSWPTRKRRQRAQPSQRTPVRALTSRHARASRQWTMSDLAVVAMDPRFGGGGRAQLDAFLEAARDLGRTPALHNGRMPSRLRPVDSVNQAVAGVRIAPLLRDARSVWVVATSASNGWAAARSNRPYSAWIGTGLAEEWAGRRPGLRPSRRAAITVNAPVLR